MKAKQDTRKGRNLKKNTHKTGVSQDVKQPPVWSGDETENLTIRERSNDPTHNRYPAD